MRVFLADTASPTGLLRELRYRLADAERELPRARDEQQRQRIEQDVQALRQQITEQDLQSREPRAAAAITDQRITTNMEAVRQPERPEPAVVARARFVNAAPVTAPSYFQDRHTKTGLIGESLRSDDQRLITVVGRGGVGKTAMVCRLLKAVEGGRLPDDGVNWRWTASCISPPGRIR